MKTLHELPVTFILEFDKESGFYASQLKEYPQVISQGKTQKEAMENTIDGFMEFVKLYKETKPLLKVKASANRIIKKSKILMHA